MPVNHFIGHGRCPELSGAELGSLEFPRSVAFRRQLSPFVFLQRIELLSLISRVCKTLIIPTWGKSKKDFFIY